MSRQRRLSSIAATSGRTFVRFIAASYERLRRNAGGACVVLRNPT